VKIESQPIKHFFAETGLLCGCMLPSLLIAFWGLSRRYDAVPDQDLLWVSEALRAIRGVAPSYADHPGAFWSIFFRLSINVLSQISNQEVIDSAGRITPESIQKLISIGRITNGVVCGLTAYLVFPVSRALSIPTKPCAALALISGLSSAILVGVSEIRHETIGIAFLMLSILLFNSSIQQQSRSWRRYSYAAASTSTLIAAAFCKNQTLFLFPLYFIACIAIYSKYDQGASWQLKNIKHSKFSAKALGFISASSLPWLISAIPDIDLINLPFWAAINSGTALLIGVQIFDKVSWKNCYRGIGFLATIQIVVFRLASPQWWRQAITGFPSWMLRYANVSESPDTKIMEQTANGINQYASGITAPATLAIGLYILIVVTLLLNLIISSAKPSDRQDGTQMGLSSAWLFCTASILANSQRIATRYEIYIFIPVIITSAYTAHALLKHNFQPKTRRPMTALASIASILIATMAIKSLSNLTNLKSFILTEQPREWVCIGHHMDRSMALTSAGECDVFPRASKEKDHYDPWAGPR